MPASGRALEPNEVGLHALNVAPLTESIAQGGHRRLASSSAARTRRSAATAVSSWSTLPPSGPDLGSSWRCAVRTPIVPSLEPGLTGGGDGGLPHTFALRENAAG